MKAQFTLHAGLFSIWMDHSSREDRILNNFMNALYWCAVRAEIKLPGISAMRY